MRGVTLVVVLAGLLRSGMSFAEPVEPVAGSTDVPSAAPSAAPSAVPTSFRYVLSPAGLDVIERRGDMQLVIASLALPGQKHQLLEYRDHLYVACDMNGVAVIDVSQPAHPVLKGSIAQGLPTLRLGVTGTRMIVGLGTGQQMFFDVSQPELPKFAGYDRLVVTQSDREERPVLPRPRRQGLGLTIAGASVFGGLYTLTAICSIFDLRLLVPVGGPIWSTASVTTALVPVGILDGGGQLAGLIMLFAGASQLVSSGSSTASLMPNSYGQPPGGLFVVGQF